MASAESTSYLVFADVDELKVAACMKGALVKVSVFAISKLFCLFIYYGRLASLSAVVA